MNQKAPGCVFPDLDSQTLLFDLEFRQVVLAHEIEDLLQLLKVDYQCVIGNCRIAELQNCRIATCRKTVATIPSCNPAILQIRNFIAPAIRL